MIYLSVRLQTTMGIEMNEFTSQVSVIYYLVCELSCNQYYCSL